MGLFKKSGQSSGGSSLQDEKLKSDIIVNSIDDAVVLIDSQNVIQAFNPAAARITGWEQNEALKLDYRSVIQLVDDKGNPYESAAHPFQQVFLGKTVRDNNAALKTRDGRTILVDISVTPLLDSTNKVNGAVGIIRDVNEQRKEEKQRADFISTASHEMRTPVAAIEGYLALALNDKVSTIDSKARSYLEKAHASTQHLGKLFQDLLTSAKAEDGRLTNHPTIVELGEFTEKLVDDLRFTAEKKGLQLELLIGAQQQRSVDASAGQKVIKPLLYARVDPDRFREVVTNLFDNAVKYTEAGKVSIGITGDDKVVQIYIADTGPGIPREDIPHLFQKFYRVDNSATRTIGGTGLGLFICRKIIELYGGRIWVESELGKGSKFYINVPRLATSDATRLLAEEQVRSKPII